MPEMNTTFFRGDAQRGQYLLHLRQNRVVAATRAPAHVLVGVEILPVSLADFAAGSDTAAISRWRHVALSLLI